MLKVVTLFLILWQLSTIIQGAKKELKITYPIKSWSDLLDDGDINQRDAVDSDDAEGFIRVILYPNQGSSRNIDNRDAEEDEEDDVDDLTKNGFIKVNTYPPATDNRDLSLEDIGLRDSDDEEEEEEDNDTDEDLIKRGFIKVNTYPPKTDNRDLSDLEADLNAKTPEELIERGFIKVNTYPESTNSRDASDREQDDDDDVDGESLRRQGFVEVKSYPSPTGRDFADVNEDVVSNDEDDDEEEDYVDDDVDDDNDEEDADDDDDDDAGDEDNEDDVDETEGRSGSDDAVADDNKNHKDCRPKPKPVQSPRSLQDIIMANDVNNICPKTCAGENLKWGGTWGSVNGRDPTVCECEKAKENESDRSLEPDVYGIKECEVDFCSSLISVHNMHRRHHFLTPPLVKDNDLTSGASLFAKKIAQVQKVMPSDSMGKYGENLGTRYLPREQKLTKKFCTTLAKKITNMWYDENVNWDYLNSKPKSGKLATQHFTQLIWRESNKIGCGLAVGKRGQNFYAVVRYAPMGNTPGKFEKNVKPFGPRL